MRVGCKIKMVLTRGTIRQRKHQKMQEEKKVRETNFIYCKEGPKTDYKKAKERRWSLAQSYMEKMTLLNNTGKKALKIKKK